MLDENVVLNLRMSERKAVRLLLPVELLRRVGHFAIDHELFQQDAIAVLLMAALDAAEEAEHQTDK
jgi:hypothetical protein